MDRNLIKAKIVLIPKLIAGMLTAFVTVATLIFGFFDYGPRVFQALDNTDSYRNDGNKCLTQARNIAASGEFSDAALAYRCAEKNFRAAAKQKDPRSSYALALIYSDPKVDEILQIDRITLGKMAMNRWCEARKLGFRPAAIEPPFLEFFPELPEVARCL